MVYGVWWLVVALAYFLLLVYSAADRGPDAGEGGHPALPPSDSQRHQAGMQTHYHTPCSNPFLLHTPYRTLTTIIITIPYTYTYTISPGELRDRFGRDGIQHLLRGLRTEQALPPPQEPAAHPAQGRTLSYRHAQVTCLYGVRCRG